MLAHYDAIVAVLAATGFGGAYFVEAVGEDLPALPYWVVEPGTGDAGPDLPVAGETDSLDLTFRVKSVAGTPRTGLATSRNARTALCPMGRVATLAVQGRAVTLMHVRHEADYTEKVVTPTTNRAVAISVDTYRLVSSPA